jgi:hypothetical protein
MMVSNSQQLINSVLVNQLNSLNSSEKTENTIKEEQQKVDGYNTTSKLYFKLSEDVSQYATANPTQDKIDEDVMSILSKYEDGDLNDFFKFHPHMIVAFTAQSEEGQKHALELATSEKSKILSESIMNFERLKKKNLENNKSTFLDMSNRKVNLENITLVGENFAHYNRANKEDMAKLEKEEKNSFQNTYRFSDEFAKTEKFDELFAEYKKESERLGNEAHEKGDYFAWSYIFNNDFLEVEKAMVIGKGYSKSEWIESIDKTKTLLEDIMKNNPDMMSSVKVDLKDNIEFFENILTDLKELWHYGDFNANG